jgi:hypothetical protein
MLESLEVGIGGVVIVRSHVFGQHELPAVRRGDGADGCGRRVLGEGEVGAAIGTI